MTEWQPIATAPRDGTEVLGWMVHPGNAYNEEPFARPSIISWEESVPGEYGHPARWDAKWIGEPTHWMPLPTPPEGGAGHGTASSSDDNQAPGRTKNPTHKGSQE